MTVAEPLLKVSRLSKAYSTVVLSNVGFDLWSGEVHALVGENGAGKSTLARIIAGLTEPDSGEMALRNEKYRPRNKVEAEHHGVRLVMQELNLVGTLSVAENIFLDQLPHRWGWVNYPELHRRAWSIMEEIGLGGVDPACPVSWLGVGQQQLVEIAAGISRRCEVLILDEPTAALTDPEIERLFRQIRKLQVRGTGIIYISHRLEEIQQLADRISVLRDGQMIASRPTADFPMDDIVRLMVGRDLGTLDLGPAATAGTVALRVSRFRAPPAVHDVSFEVRHGEILGFAGLMGSGRTETMRTVFGADPRESGEVYLQGSMTPARIRSPQDAVGQGLALLTEDRKSQGLLLPQPIRANVTLSRMHEVSRWNTWIARDREEAAAQHWSALLKIRCTSVEQRTSELSGGNQQKVVLGKWLFRNCDILIFDEPTRGIDVGAKFEIYQVLRDLAAKGKAIVVVSSDLKELLALCDRLIVLSAGRVAGAFQRGEWTQEKIMAAALSGYLKRKDS